jgi:hypothetical protein
VSVVARLVALAVAAVLATSLPAAAQPVRAYDGGGATTSVPSPGASSHPTEDAEPASSGSGPYVGEPGQLGGRDDDIVRCLMQGTCGRDTWVDAWARERDAREAAREQEMARIWQADETPVDQQRMVLRYQAECGGAAAGGSGCKALLGDIRRSAAQAANPRPQTPARLPPASIARGSADADAGRIAGAQFDHMGRQLRAEDEKLRRAETVTRALTTTREKELNRMHQQQVEFLLDRFDHCSNCSHRRRVDVEYERNRRQSLYQKADWTREQLCATYGSPSSVPYRNCMNLTRFIVRP